MVVGPQTGLHAGGCHRSVTTEDLARSYLLKGRKRLKVLDVLFQEEDYSDVVREAQEIVELCLKGMLRAIGIEPPRFRDVGPLLLEHREMFRGGRLSEIGRLARISRELRKERELAFYGDIDFIPTEQ
jgi:HEPN domain-containing protein